MILTVCVDGGASSCRLAAFSENGEVLARVVIDAHASLSLGVAAAWSHIDAGLQALRSELQLESHWQPAVLSMGLAGSLHSERAQELLALVHPATRALLNTDGYAQLTGATGGKAGICLAVGTGSVMHWQGQDGIAHMAGGWGFPVGDQGSGAWLGVRLLQVFIAHKDGHTCDSTMMDAVEQCIGSSAASIVAWTTETRSGVIAQLAPLVLDAADAFDPVACNLVDEAVEHCMKLICLAPEDLPVYVVGGVGLRLRPWFSETLDQRLCLPRYDALRGLWHIARIEHTKNEREIE